MIVIYRDVKILYLNEKNKTDWLTVELDMQNDCYILNKSRINVNDVKIKAVLFNDVSVFNQLISDCSPLEAETVLTPKMVIKTKEKIAKKTNETENKIGE